MFFSETRCISLYFTNNNCSNNRNTASFDFSSLLMTQIELMSIVRRTFTGCPSCLSAASTGRVGYLDVENWSSAGARYLKYITNRKLWFSRLTLHIVTQCPDQGVDYCAGDRWFWSRFGLVISSVPLVHHGWCSGIVVRRWTKLRNNLGQAVHTYVPLSSSSITWYWSKDSDVLQLGRWPQTWWK